VGASPWASLVATGLGTLAAYLLVRGLVEPGFTDYWGLMLGQITGTLVLVVALTSWSAQSGGFSWYTYLVILANTWADTLGTAGHLYENHASYDKLTHFLSGVALTAAAIDLLRSLRARGVVRISLTRCLFVAIASTFVINIGWETYEYLSEAVFHATRHAGALDTMYDFVSDMAGATASAIVVGLLVSHRNGRTPLDQADQRASVGVAAPLD
jgi:uncharacterized membrane protein YjdF